MVGHRTNQPGDGEWVTNADLQLRVLAQSLSLSLSPPSSHAQCPIIIPHNALQCRVLHALEELALGRPVVVHGCVEVKMVASEVGEEGNAEGDIVHSAKREGVGGYLHHARTTLLRERERETEGE